MAFCFGVERVFNIGRARLLATGYWLTSGPGVGCGSHVAGLVFGRDDGVCEVTSAAPGLVNFNKGGFGR